MKWLERLKQVDFPQLVHLQLELRPTLRAIPYWFAAVLVGGLAVVYSSSFSAVIEASQWVQQHYPMALLGMGPVAFVLASWLVSRFAPLAGGTGIPQVTSIIPLDAVNGAAQIEKTLNLKVAVVVILSSLICVLGGGSVGREGPMVHIAACVFYFVARQFSVIWPYQEHRSWIVAGGAAGVAAAFNTPLAGIVFVLEELAQQHFHQFKTVVISAVIVAGMMAQWLSGKYLFLGYPKIETVGFAAVPYAVIVGGVCGTLAGIFERLREWSSEASKMAREKFRLGFAALMGLIVSGIAVFVDHRTIGGGIGAIQEFLFRDGKASWGFLFGKFFALLFSYLSGCAGGFLAPALTLGASVGSKLAGWLSPKDHNLLVMVGMAGFLSAMTRAPFTALVIVMEMTDRHSTIFLLMISSLVAFGTSRLVMLKRPTKELPVG